MCTDDPDLCAQMIPCPPKSHRASLLGSKQFCSPFVGKADSIDEDGSKLTFELPNDAQVGGDLMPLARLLASISASNLRPFCALFQLPVS